MTLPKGTPRPCKGCGKVILKLTFCTNKCRQDWYRQRDHDERRAHGVLPILQHRELRKQNAERDCEQCNGKFLPSGGAKPNRFCSRACSSVSRRMYKTPEQIASAKRAENERYNRRRGVRPISEVKKLAKERAANKAHDLAERMLVHVCRDCSGGLPDLKRTYCPPCADRRAAARRRANKAKSKAVRRARSRAAQVEAFDPLSVLERDGWRCHICRIKTPKRLRGTYEDNAPELDHIIPLAAGGEHSRRNTACACRRCNIRKADKPLGQLRLIA